MLERLFGLSKRNTNVRTEVIAGITTFMTMAYILFVNPNMLSIGGMDHNAVLLATAIGAGCVTIAMGLIVNYPIALAPGMGLNAFFTFSVVLGFGVPWQVALGAVFISGVVFILLTVTHVRQLLVEGMPTSLKHAITVGIGLFITIIGLKLSGIMAIILSLSASTMESLAQSHGNGVPSPVETLIGLGQFTPSVLLTIFGFVLTSLLMARNVNGSMLIGIIVTTIVAIITGIAPIPENFAWVSIPDFSNNAFLALDIMGAMEMGLFTIIFTFTFVELFDTMGTLVGTANKAGITDEKGNFPGMGKAMMVDALGVSFGSLLGTSAITAYVESTSGVAAGGRTGLTAVVTGILFFLALFLTPLIQIVPGEATAPALIIVGALMLESIKKIDLADLTEAIPAFITIVAMPFTYSIANGISFGLVMYPLMKAVTGRYKEVHWIVWILAALVVARYVFLSGH